MASAVWALTWNRRWSPAAFLLVLAALMPQAAMAQGGAPAATLFFPTGVTGPFGLADPIPLVVQVTGDPFLTTKGASKLDWLSLLRFAAPGGGTITATGGAATHTETQPIQCLSRSGVALNPPIPVVPVETLALPLEQSTPNIRTRYDIPQPGTYRAEARIPFARVLAVITDCDQAPGVQVVNVGSGTSLQGFTAVSNTLQFSICCYTFAGFIAPLANESLCAVSPCLTARVGRSVPVKFQLSLNGAVFKTAVAFISVTPLSGQPPVTGDLGNGAVPINQFVFEQPTGHYHFTLETSVLTPGIWRINVSIDDGSVHKALIELTP